MKVRFGSGAMALVFPLLWSLLAVTTYPLLAEQTQEQINENRLLLPTYEREELKRRGRMGERQTSREPRLPEAQIIEDFRHLQLLNNQVRESTVQQGGRQKGLIKPLGKIRKRAKRLKANLVLTGGGDQEATSELGSDVGLEALLRRLDQSIKSFVRNPMFHSTKVVDLGLARSARLDLERVIELSGMIADRIRKEVR